ncbi:hypothetical protein SAMN06893096_10223 [Geodermatophilus pulveris]|uniref:Uncharacterized protein n=1 Tax=Geodermatophilus pulveris TaxID=1564159 RepID=A0A239BQR5_9ACTN|nr:hypothetical protein SAMN06893096_10223 [Geodermatophilus pulveris]
MTGWDTAATVAASSPPAPAVDPAADGALTVPPAAAALAAPAVPDPWAPPAAAPPASPLTPSLAVPTAAAPATGTAAAAAAGGAPQASLAMLSPSNAGTRMTRSRLLTSLSSSRSRRQSTHSVRWVSSARRSRTPREPRTWAASKWTISSCPGGAVTMCSCSQAVRRPSRARTASCATARGLMPSSGATCAGASPCTSVCHSTICHRSGRDWNACATNCCSNRSIAGSAVGCAWCKGVSASSRLSRGVIRRTRRWRSIAALRTARSRYGRKATSGPRPSRSTVYVRAKASETTSSASSVICRATCSAVPTCRS